jgi:hypothetical protein
MMEENKAIIKIDGIIYESVEDLYKSLKPYPGTDKKLTETSIRERIRLYAKENPDKNVRQVRSNRVFVNRKEFTKIIFTRNMGGNHHFDMDGTPKLVQITDFEEIDGLKTEQV